MLKHHRPFLAFVAIAALAVSAHAQITAVQGSRHAGQGTGAALGPVITTPMANPHDMLDAACLVPLAASTVAPGTYTCKTRVVKARPPVACRAPRSSTSEPVACPAGTTGQQQRVTTYSMGSAPQCVETSVTTVTGTCTPVAPPPPPPPPPPPAGALTLYFSDCQAGAAAGCSAGSNANPGTEASPKQNLAGTNVNALPAGSRLLFARGGAWANFSLSLENNNATLAAPLVFDAYGTGPAPLFRTAGGNTLNIGGRWYDGSNAGINATQDGGYTFRNLRLDGMGSADWGIWLVQNVRGVTLENMDITGYLIGVHSSQGPGNGRSVVGLTVRNSKIHRNRSMGILGGYDESSIEDNVFEANNFSGSNFNHAIYFSGGRSVAIRRNMFDANSVVNGTCLGGNVTAHGVINGLLIEGNTIRQPSAAPSCYGFSITAGYDTAERFDNVVLRGNRVSGIGVNAIAVNAAPGVLVEGNVIRNASSNAIMVPANGGSRAPDAEDGDAIVRNNTLCGGGSVNVTVPRAQVSSNVVLTGAAGSTGVCAP